MSESCNHNCESCSQNCSENKSFLEEPHKMSNIKKVIGVISGKGGVGKSMVTSLLSVTSKRLGHTTAIMDADITGPSIPKMFGITEKPLANELGLFPCRTKGGIDVMSLNLLLQNATDPVVWRGPVIGGTVKQFWTEVIWEDAEYMFIDMPPGTGDVALTVFQSIPVDGIIIVTSPQELVSMIVEKAIKMANMMNVPVLGIVENFSYLSCPDCGKRIEIFGKSHVDEIAASYNLPVLGKLPVNPELAALCDAGKIEEFEGEYFTNLDKIFG